ncbi:ABC transporter permease, partial [Hydrogenobaculum sp.]
ATDSVVSAGALITKSTLPAEIVVITRVVSNLINYLLSIPILFLFLIFFHVKISFIVLFLPLVVIIQFFLTTGIAFFPATWNVFYRDVRQIIQTIMQLLFFCMPVMYFDTQVPPKYQKLIYLNPIAYLIKCYHDIFYDNLMPRPELLILLFFISIVVYIVGFNYFHSRKDVFAEYI